ncbi:MAG: hypothetical protein ACREJ2_09215, partial [Planctomycetota bacterium]
VVARPPRHNSPKAFFRATRNDHRATAISIARNRPRPAIHALFLQSRLKDAGKTETRKGLGNRLRAGRF